MYNFYFYLPIKIDIIGFAENRIDWTMYWRLIVDTTHNDIYKRQVVRTACSMPKINGFIGDAQRSKAIIIVDDGFICLLCILIMIFGKNYDILYYSILGCYVLEGFVYYATDISECYQRCLHIQQISFKYFAFKVTSHELFSLFK